MNKMFIGLIMFFLTLDFATKIWAEIALQIGEGYQQTVIPNLSWFILYNRGFSLSVLEDYPSIVLLLNFIALCGTIFILVKILTPSHMWYLASSLIIAGGLGNFINRLYSGYVVDFISIEGHPAIFNVADIEIRIGTIIMIFLVLKEYIKEKRQLKRSDSAA